MEVLRPDHGHAFEQKALVDAGVATAFAARDILGNILSGVALQFSRPFSVGDAISVSFHVK